MTVFHIFVINRAGSLIYDLDCSPKSAELEKTVSFPLEFRFEVIDQRVTVVFGERDGVKVGHMLMSVNGDPVITGGKLMVKNEEEGGEKEVDVLQYLSNEQNYPLNVKFGRPTLTTNEKIILSSMFHSLYAIAAQLSPMPKSSGIQILDTEHFTLQCFQTLTGTKLVVVADPSAPNLDQLLKKIYELYADFALKNPFYSFDMPIRCELFDSALQTVLDRFDRSGVVTI